MTLDDLLEGDPNEIAPPPQRNMRLMSYGPIEGEYHRAAMYGPNGNPLGPQDVAASPDSGLQLGNLIDIGDGKYRMVNDWSYRRPGIPTSNTIELRDRHDAGSGPVKKVTLDDLLGGKRPPLKVESSLPPQEIRDAITNSQVPSMPPQFSGPPAPPMPPMSAEEMSRTGQTRFEPSETTAGTEPDPINTTGLVPPGVVRGAIETNPFLAPTLAAGRYFAPRQTEGVLQGIGEAGSGFTSVQNLPWLAAGAVMPGGVAGKIGNLGIAAYFEKQALEQTPELWAQYQQSNDPAEKAKLLTMIAAQIGLPAAAAAHITFGKERAAAPVSAEDDLKIRAAAQAQAPEPAPAAPPRGPSQLRQDILATLPEELPQGRVSPETGQVFETGPRQSPTSETARFTPPPPQSRMVVSDTARFQKEQPAEINVGDDARGEKLTQEQLASTLPPDVKIVGYRHQPGEDGQEGTHVVQLSRPLTEAEGNKLAVDNGQMAIPQRLANGQGTMFLDQDRVSSDPGWNPDWSQYNEDYFKRVTEAKPAEAQPIVPQEAPGAGITKADVEPKMQRMGSEAPEFDPTSRDEADAVAAKREKANPNIGERLTDQILRKPRPVSNVEVSILRRHITKLETAKDSLIDEINRNGTSDELGQQLDEVSAKLIDAYGATRYAGRGTAQGLQAFQDAELQRLSPEKMKAELKAFNNGNAVPEHMNAQIEKIYKEASTAKQALDQLQERRAQRPVREQPKTIDTAINRIKGEANEALKRLNRPCL